MANETNKVPCGGFKVGGGLSVNDGMLKMGCIVAAKVYRTWSIADQQGWIVPYEAFQTENALLTIDQDGYKIKILDCFVAILAGYYEIDFNEDGTTKSFTYDLSLDLTASSFEVSETDKKLNVKINGKDFIAEEITLPEEMKHIPGFREKGYSLYTIG